MVGLAGNKATQPSLAGAWAELGKISTVKFSKQRVPDLASQKLVGS